MKSAGRARLSKAKKAASSTSSAAAITVPPGGAALPAATSSSSSAASSGQRLFLSLPKWTAAAPTVMITDAAGMSAAAAKLTQHSRIAVDCEGVALSRKGRLCLVQLASPDDVFIVDIVVGGAALFDAGLRELLESPRCIKVMHDCRHDCDALLHQFGVRLAPVLDTQISFSVLRRVRKLPVGLPVSLKTLLRKFCGVSVDDLAVKDSVKTAMRERETFWLDRPLDATSLLYARFDVVYLLHVAKIMAIHITNADSEGWERVLKESEVYSCLFRDDSEGPRKENARWAAMLTKAKADQVKRDRRKVAEGVRSTDPMRKFSFNKVLVLDVFALRTG